MKPIWHLVALGVAVNADNLAVGAAYGVRRILIPPATNLVIAGMAFVFSAVSAWLGSLATRIVSPSVANEIGAVLIAAIGVWMLAPKRKPVPHAQAHPDSPASVLEVLNEPELADRDHSGVIQLSESLVLGVALSLNCLSNGLCAGVLNFGVVQAALINAVFSFVAVWAGMRLGALFGSLWLSRWSDVLGGALMVALGAHQWLSHG